MTQKDALSGRIADYEKRFQRKNPEDARLLYLLSHARKEWAHETYEQCEKDLDRMDKLSAGRS